MLLRRVIDHVRAQNWLAVGIDFVIVVVGVFMGLQVQEWNQQRTDRAEERAYLERLSSDFTRLERQLRSALALYRNSVEAIAFVSRAVDARARSDDAPAPDADAFADALLRLSGGALPAGRAATFVEMVSSGELNILRDAALRDALIAYDQHAQINREAWRSLRDEAVAYQRPLYEAIDLTVDLEDPTVTAVGGYDLAAMAADPDFRSMLNVLAGMQANNYELSQRQLTLAERARGLVDRNRGVEKPAVDARSPSQ